MIYEAIAAATARNSHDFHLYSDQERVPRHAVVLEVTRTLRMVPVPIIDEEGRPRKRFGESHMKPPTPPPRPPLRPFPRPVGKADAQLEES